MRSPPQEPSLYYHASGKKVPLAVDEDSLAIDVGVVEKLPKKLRDVVSSTGRSVSERIRLVSRNALSKETFAALQDCSGLLKVLHAAGSRLIPLPEVRVEESSPRALRIIRSWLKTHADQVEILRDNPGMMVLRPRSGSGIDAVTVANDLVENAEASSATPRFLRIARKP